MVYIMNIRLNDNTMKTVEKEELPDNIMDELKIHGLTINDIKTIEVSYKKG